MKIYTKKADKGETSLLGGKRVSKSNIRIDSYGTVDELNSWLGLIRDQKIDSDIKKISHSCSGQIIHHRFSFGF